MNKVLKRIISLSVTCAMLLSASGAFAAEFIDMPDNWTTSALENAAKNGLLYGEEAVDGSGMKINPDDNITRAQMAAIIVRAFGATETADISTYTDVDKNAWYYTELSKAVAMNAFRGDGDLMNPQNNITFQECFTVVSQILQLQVYAEDTSVIEKFADYEDVAEWAVPYAAAVVGSGYWDGIDGKLLPKEYITRSQFAVLINNIADTYIDEPGTYSEVGGKNVMVRSDNVVLSGGEMDNVIVGDGISKTVKIDGATVSNVIYVRGVNAAITKNSTVNDIILLTPQATLNIGLIPKSIYRCHETNVTTFGVQEEIDAIKGEAEETEDKQEEATEDTEVTE